MQRFLTMKFLAFLIILYPVFFFSQNYVGTNALAFLNTNYSARSIALGGNLIATQDNDLSMAAENPALLNSKSVRMLQINQSIL